MGAALAFVSAAAFASTAAIADERITPLLKQQLEGLEDMEASIAYIEADGGFETERHIHPGHVFLYVIEGAIEILVDGTDPVLVSAGEAAYETPNQAMVGRNASSTDAARFVLFQVGKSGEPMTVPSPR